MKAFSPSLKPGIFCVCGHSCRNGEVRRASLAFPSCPQPLFWENVLEKRLYFLRTQASGPFQLRMPPALQPLCPLTFKFFAMCLGLVVQKMDSAIHCISMRKMNCTIQWIEIYLMDSVIHLLNNWDQVIV